MYLDFNKIRWAESLSSVKQWKKHYRKSIFRFFLGFGLFSVLSLYLLKNNAEDLSKEDLVISVFIVIMFVAASIHFFIKWLRSFRLSIKNIYVGTVETKSRCRQNDLRHRRSSYFIIANINEKKYEGKCFCENFRKLNKNDQVLLFTIGTKELFAVNIED